MLDAIREMLASKKWLAVLAGIATTITGYAGGAMTGREAFAAILVLIIGGLVGQSVADNGKSAAAINAAAADTKTATDATTPPNPGPKV